MGLWVGRKAPGSAAPPASWFRCSPDRKGKHPKGHLAGYRGWLHAPSHGLLANHCRVTDGYVGFGDIREVACMAHVRRTFVDVHRAQGSAIADEAIMRTA